MAYLALYRAYRPQQFSEVVDQKPIVRTLENAIKADKVAHAYLFCGPRGTGKTTLAKIFAKALNCKEGPTINPCLECDICKSIQNGSNPDVIEIDAASNNGADDIRQLRDSVKFLPSTAKYKVYIIDEVHMLSNAAFNALLKTLEEPPKYVVFILCTTEPYKIPETILSRCQRFDFKAISNDGIYNRLKEVSKEENINISDEAIEEITNLAEGGMRDALSLLDQVISYVTEDNITINDVYEVSGNVAATDLLELLKLIMANESEKAIDFISSLYNKGKEINKIAEDFILFLRDILLFKIGIFNTNKAIFKDDDFKNSIADIGKNLIFNWINLLQDSINQMKFSNQKRSYLDLTILKMCDEKNQKENSIIDKIKYLETTLENLQSEINKRPVQTIDIKPTTIKQIDNIAQTKKSDDSYITIEEINEVLNNGDKAVRERFNLEWPKIKSKYQDIPAMSFLEYGKVGAVSNKAIIFVLQDEGFCNRVMKAENYYQLLDVVHNSIENVEEIYCLPNNKWNTILKDFKNKFNATTNPKPILDPLEIKVKKPQKLEDKEEEKDETVDKLIDIFGDKIKIKE